MRAISVARPGHLCCRHDVLLHCEVPAASISLSIRPIKPLHRPPKPGGGPPLPPNPGGGPPKPGGGPPGNGGGPPLPPNPGAPAPGNPNPPGTGGGGPPTPIAGPPSPIGNPLPAGLEIPAPGVNAAPVGAAVPRRAEGSEGGGPSTLQDTMLVPRRIMRPSVRLSSVTWGWSVEAEPGAVEALFFEGRLTRRRNSSVSARTRFMCWWGS